MEWYLASDFDHNVRIRLEMLVTKYVVISDLLYRRSFYGSLLRCLMRYEVEMSLKQAHDGECRGHFNAKFIYQRFIRLGYYYPIVPEGYELHINKCEQCQKNAKLQPSPLHGLYFIISP